MRHPQSPAPHWQYGAIVPALLLSLLAPGSWSDPEEPRPPGRLVDIGGYRLHLHSTGRGEPNVVLLSGMGAFSFAWGLVQPRVAAFARVSSYDRAGDAWSEAGPVPRTIRQEAHELHLLLRRAGLKAPYVLVGASYGGLIARRYAADYPGEVAGVVLVDATHENTILSAGSMVNGRFEPKLVRIREASRGRPVPPVQTMKTSPPQPASERDRREWEAVQKEMGPPRIEPPLDRLPTRLQQLQLWAKSHPKLTAPSDDYMSEEFQEMYTARARTRHPLGSIPLISLRAGQNLDFVPPLTQLQAIKMTPDDWRRESEAKAADLASLSSDSLWYVARTSRHEIHLDDPELVTFAIRRVVEAARTRRPLTARPAKSTLPK